MMEIINIKKQQKKEGIIALVLMIYIYFELSIFINMYHNILISPIWPVINSLFNICILLVVIKLAGRLNEYWDIFNLKKGQYLLLFFFILGLIIYLFYFENGLNIGNLLLNCMMFSLTRTLYCVIYPSNKLKLFFDSEWMAYFVCSFFTILIYSIIPVYKGVIIGNGILNSTFSGLIGQAIGYLLYKKTKSIPYTLIVSFIFDLYRICFLG